MTPILHFFFIYLDFNLRAFLGELRGKIAHKQRVNLNCHNTTPATKATEMFQSSDKIKD